jgi:ribosomal protein L37AE/L43A/predicted  nucleic acid-binding Zn-ribbon protein
VGAQKNNKNEILSRIVADLSVKSRGDEELLSKVRRLRDEIKKIIENEDTIFGKFNELVESFREIIPEEKQRYNAAIKALSATSKLSRQEILKGINNQLEELKILEKGLRSALPGHDELKVMEAKSRDVKNEILKLREKIGRLENEEKEILNGISARQKEMEHVEKAVVELFTDIGEKITYTKRKVEEVTAGSTTPQTIQPRDSIINHVPSEDKRGDEQKIEIREPSSQQDSEGQKKCPMCGGRMNFHIAEQTWMCYSCAYREFKKGGDEQKIEIREPSSQQDSEGQKKCPMCGGRMNFHIAEQTWMCYSCAYEEPKKDEVQGKVEEKSELTNAPKPIPAMEPTNEYEKSTDESSSSNNHPSSKKKTCPVCRKKMNWHQMEEAWRCPYCHYERRI